MQRMHLASRMLHLASITTHFHNSTLILVGTDIHHNKELIDLAYSELHSSNPGASLLCMDSIQSALGGSYHSVCVLMQLFDHPRMRSRLLAFPPHEVFGHIALQLITQGVPVSALNAMPVKRPYSCISANDLLLVLPRDYEGCSPITYLH